MGSVSFKFNRYATSDVEACNEMENVAWSVLRLMDNLGDTGGVKLKIYENYDSIQVEVSDKKGAFDFLENQEEIEAYISSLNHFVEDYSDDGFVFS